MEIPKKTDKKVFAPIGQKEDWKRDTLLALSLISMSDIKSASVRWDTLAPKPFRGMLDAVISTDPRNRPPGWWYDPTIVSYGFGARTVNRTVVRGAAIAAVNKTTTESQKLAKAVALGLITVQGWQEQMAVLVNKNQSMLTAAAGGGTNGVDASDIRIGQGRTEFQLKRLIGFASDIAPGGATSRKSGEAATSTTVWRAGLYVTTTMTTFEAVRRNSATEAYLQERRLMRPAEHCVTCIEQAAMGWQPIGTLNEIGDSECMGFCRCYFVYQSKALGA